MGNIYFRLEDDQFFPEKGWTDLVGAFLRAWLSALISIANGQLHKQDAPFFDGPLAVYLSSQDRNLVELNFVLRKVTKFTTIGATSELMQNAISVARQPTVPFSVSAKRLGK